MIESKTTADDLRKAANALLRARIIKCLDEMIVDLMRDSEWMDGKPFDGKTVAEIFGRMGSIVAAMAATIKTYIVSQE